MTGLETKPVVRLQGEQRANKSKRVGRKLSKLAQAVPAVVRSYDEQIAHCRMAATAVPTLVARRARLPRKTENDKRHSHNLTLAINKLCVPMFGIRFADDTSGSLWFVSANVLSDYYREGIAVEVLAYPVIQRFGRHASIRKADVDREYVEKFAASRANDHAMGMAQNAWRYAHVEGDYVAERAAYHWLWHGSLKPCRDKECEKRHEPWHYGDLELQSLILNRLALSYLSEQESRSHFYGSRMPHKARKPSVESNLAPYVAESYDEARNRLGMVPVVFEESSN